MPATDGRDRVIVVDGGGYRFEVDRLAVERGPDSVSWSPASTRPGARARSRTRSGICCRPVEDAAVSTGARTISPDLLDDQRSSTPPVRPLHAAA
ncbi:MAG TPA: hypothetical protein VGN22_09090 [Pseudonocardia sp.]